MAARLRQMRRREHFWQELRLACHDPLEAAAAARLVGWRRLQAKRYRADFGPRDQIQRLLSLQPYLYAASLDRNQAASLQIKRPLC